MFKKKTTVWYWHKDRYTNQQDESPEVNTYIYH